MTITNEQAVVLTVGGVIVQAALYIVTALRAWKQRQAEKARYAAEREVHALKNQLALAEAEADAMRGDRDEAESLYDEANADRVRLEEDNKNLINRLADKILALPDPGEVEAAEKLVESLRVELTKSNEEIETLRAAVKQSSAWWTSPQTVQPYFQWKCSTCGVSVPTGQSHMCYGSGNPITWTGTITTADIHMNDYVSVDNGSTRKTCLCLGACDCKPPSKPSSLPKPKESF